MPGHERQEDARRQLEPFLRGFGWEGEFPDPLIERCLLRLQAEGSAGAELLDAVEAAATTWARAVFAPAGEREDSALLVARAAFRACEGPRRWAHCFLADELPEAFLAAMRAAAPAPLPPEAPEPMLAQPFVAWSIGRLLPLTRRSGRLGSVGKGSAAAA